jgi:hypothetical protein
MSTATSETHPARSLTTAFFRSGYRHILYQAAPVAQADGNRRLAVSGPALASLEHFENVAADNDGDEHAYRVSGARVAMAELRAGEHVLEPGVGQLTYAMLTADGVVT